MMGMMGLKLGAQGANATSEARHDIQLWHNDMEHFLHEQPFVKGTYQ